MLFKTPPKKFVFIICVNPVVAEILSYNTVLTSSYTSVTSTHYFYWVFSDSKNIKISQVISRNTSFELFLSIFEILISDSQSLLIMLNTPGT